MPHGRCRYASWKVQIHRASDMKASSCVEQIWYSEGEPEEDTTGETWTLHPSTINIETVWMCISGPRSFRIPIWKIIDSRLQCQWRTLCRCQTFNRIPYHPPILLVRS